jgi:hypothetical protein
VLIEVIAYLRQRNPAADEKLLSLLRSTVNKMFKKKSSNKINSYSEGKLLFLDAVAKQAIFYNKKHLIPSIESFRTGLSAASNPGRSSYEIPMQQY